MRDDNEEAQNMRSNLEKVINEFKFEEKNLKNTIKDMNAEMGQIIVNCEKYKKEYNKIHV